MNILKLAPIFSLVVGMASLAHAGNVPPQRETFLKLIHSLNLPEIPTFKAYNIQPGETDGSTARYLKCVQQMRKLLQDDEQKAFWKYDNDTFEKMCDYDGTYVMVPGKYMKKEFQREGIGAGGTDTKSEEIIFGSNGKITGYRLIIQNRNPLGTKTRFDNARTENFKMITPENYLVSYVMSEGNNGYVTRIKDLNGKFEYEADYSVTEVPNELKAGPSSVDLQKSLDYDLGEGLHLNVWEVNTIRIRPFSAEPLAANDPDVKSRCFIQVLKRLDVPSDAAIKHQIFYDDRIEGKCFKEQTR